MCVMYNVESKKYVTRLLVEDDFQDVKNLIKKNKYLGILWNTNAVSEEHLDELIRAVYIKNDSYCVVDKQTGKFCGFISMTHEDNEGELSVRMEEHVDMDEVMELFGEMIKRVAPTDGETNLTIQYCFE